MTDFQHELTGFTFFLAPLKAHSRLKLSAANSGECARLHIKDEKGERSIMARSSSLTVKSQQWPIPPISFRTFFKTLYSALTSLTPEEWAEAEQTALASLPRISSEGDPKRRAEILIWRALVRASLELVREVSPLALRLWPEDQDKALDVMELTIPYRNFDPAAFQSDPAGLPLLADIKPPFKQWFASLSIEEGRLDALVDRLNPYFLWTLDLEAAKEADIAPFPDKTGLDRAWRSYELYMKKQVHEPAFFHETFGLAQIYIPLAVWIASRGGRKKTAAGSPSGPAKPLVKDLWQYVESWSETGREDMVLLSGLSGSGRTSSAKTLTLNLLKKGRVRAFYGPLSRIAASGPLFQNLAEYASSSGFFQVESIEESSGLYPLVLILDGLDELPTTGRSLEAGALDLLGRLRSELDRLNQDGRRIMALVTTTPNLLEAIESELPAAFTTLNLLPYFIPEDQREGFFDPDGLLERNLSQTWWTIYSRVIGRDMTKFVESLQRVGRPGGPLKNRPLAHYFLALALERDQVALSEKTGQTEAILGSLNALHKLIFDERKPYRYLYPIDQKDFFSAVFITATSTWRYNGPADPEQIKAFFKKQRIEACLENFIELARSGVLGLVKIASAPGPVGHHHRRIFEFVHPGLAKFGQALVVLAMLRALREDLARRNVQPFVGADERLALLKWAELCGPGEMDLELFSLIKTTIAREKEEDVSVWQDVCLSLIDQALAEGIPMESAMERLTFQEQTRQARNAEEALLAAHFACAQVLERTGRPKWPDTSSALGWIRRLQDRRGGKEGRLALRALGFLDFSGCFLEGLDLRRADFTQADLTAARLSLANLDEARLHKARLNEADLSEARLRRADLSLAYLRRANLHRCDLTGANLHKADLSDADLSGADFSGADLSLAVLTGANLQGAIFTGANLDATEPRPTDRPLK
ncbi:MAG: pentapeptide repeat-containing protein [Deltaproteobacteria bacterium]|nr:pentapeptide repeat-containing protein [Deltaproteobacteria bacterium]